MQGDAANKGECSKTNDATNRYSDISLFIFLLVHFRANLNCVCGQNYDWEEFVQLDDFCKLHFCTARIYHGSGLFLIAKTRNIYTGRRAHNHTWTQG
mmetsp:Transcript_13663/g.24441  ORF Transcript_13663/g.24441 Transcript_13663/m.24441 type:complete len:97 (-) Transcript_13663:227-517(-)